MSYDLELTELDGSVVMFDEPHNAKGGTYNLYETHEAKFNITFNYANIYAQHNFSVKELDGVIAGDVIDKLALVISELEDDDVETNYWYPSEGNAKKALVVLYEWSVKYPDKIWNVCY